MKNWITEQTNLLITNYKDKTYAELSDLLNIPINKIQTKVYNLKLNKEYGKKLFSIWNKDDINLLISLYPNTKNIEISKILNKTKEQIKSKSYELNLHKTKEHINGIRLENCLSHGNRLLSFDVVKDIASKYKTKKDFQESDPSAYTTANKNGWIENVCSHMTKQNYSTPQLILRYIISIIIDDNIVYNDRRKVYPYELDIFLPSYNLAFEYDGKRWHTNNTNDQIKNDICNKNNINLIRIKENNRNYIDDIKKQLIENLSIINKHCALNIQENDIININSKNIYDDIKKYILDTKNIKKIIQKYEYYWDFVKNEQKLYRHLRGINCLIEYTSQLKRKRIDWTNDRIIEEISKYEYLSDLIKKSNPCYIFCKRHGFDNLLKILKR